MTPLEAALARLAASRAQLRQALVPAGGAPADARHRRRGRARWRWWLARSPLAAVLLPMRHAVAAWWQAQAWRPAAEVAVGVAEQELLPTVRRHPWLSVAVAALLGAALVHGRPWRWPVLARQASLWRGAAWAAVAAQLARPETQAALAAALIGAAGPGRPQEGGRHGSR